MKPPAYNKRISALQRSLIALRADLATLSAECESYKLATLNKSTTTIHRWAHREYLSITAAMFVSSALGTLEDQQ